MQYCLVLINAKECLDYNSWLDRVHKTMSSETHSAPVVCEKCAFHGYSFLPKGTPIEEAKCPPCGCKNLHKPNASEFAEIEKWNQGISRDISEIFKRNKESGKNKQP
jgi:hypothetical protein